MNNQQKFTPKYWAVHDTQSDDIFIKSLSKNYRWSVEQFLDYYSYEVMGVVVSDDDLDVWWLNQSRYVCELVEIKIVTGE